MFDIRDRLGKATLDMTRVRKKCSPGLKHRPAISPCRIVRPLSQFVSMAEFAEARVGRRKVDSVFWQMKSPRLKSTALVSIFVGRGFRSSLVL